MRFCFTLLMMCVSVCCSAQQPQPQLEPNVLYREMPAAPFTSCDETLEEVELSRFKRQALQSVSASGGYMGDLGGSGLSSGFLDLSIGSGIPLGSFDNILGVKPRFRVDWVDADASLDIPSTLYQFELQFFYRRPIHDRLSAMMIFSPGVRSDLTTSDDAFRVFALGLLNWECIPDRLTLSGGAVYLGLRRSSGVAGDWRAMDTKSVDQSRFAFSRIQVFPPTCQRWRTKRNLGVFFCGTRGEHLGCHARLADDGRSIAERPKSPDGNRKDR